MLPTPRTVLLAATILAVPALPATAIDLKGVEPLRGAVAVEVNEIEALDEMSEIEVSVDEVSVDEVDVDGLETASLGDGADGLDLDGDETAEAPLEMMPEERSVETFAGPLTGPARRSETFVPKLPSKASPSMAILSRDGWSPAKPRRSSIATR